jgi:hypothetical protein
MSTSISILPSSSSGGGIETRFAQDSGISNYYYCGTATLGTTENSNGWTIKRLEILATGVVNTTTANGPSPNFNWIDRETYTYS